mgnify:CR=1 FL=1
MAATSPDFAENIKLWRPEDSTSAQPTSPSSSEVEDASQSIQNFLHNFTPGKDRPVNTADSDESIQSKTPSPGWLLV